MTNTQHTHIPTIGESPQDQHPTGGNDAAACRQDKGAEYRASPGLSEPASAKKSARLALLNNNAPRSQKKPNAQTKAEKVTIWLHPRVKEALVRIAVSENLSISATGAAFLEKAIQQDIHTQHGALLETIITQAINKGMRAYSNRLAMILVRVAFASEQTRALVTNILTRQPGVTPELLETILDGSSNTAKRNITRRTPQLAAIIEELEILFQEGK